MPGGSQHVLGPAADGLVVLTVALILAATPYLLRRRFRDEPWYLTGYAIAYGLICLMAYLLPRLWTGQFGRSVFLEPIFLGLVLLGLVLFCLQGGVPATLYASSDLQSALVGSFLATNFLLVYLMGLNGETDPMLLYPFLAPVFALIVAVPMVAELGFTAVWRVVPV